MTSVVGIRFVKAGKIHYFDPGDAEPGVGDYIVVETSHGQELGHVVLAPDQVLMSKMRDELPPIVRMATPDDLQERDRLKEKAGEALERSKVLVREMDLKMKPVEAYFTLDQAKLIVSYTSEERVDYRRVLNSLRTDIGGKVELRQIGPRDETKILGGLGRCGRSLCCSTWLTEFVPISMKMAKEQDLPLSPPGLAGVCGRLRCCLRYEYEQYRELKRGLPKIGAKVSTAQGEAVVVVGHPLKQTITVRLESGAWIEVAMDDLESRRN